MIIIERQIQKVRPGKWAELEGIDKKFTVVESRLGFPAKRRYSSFIGGQTTDTLIVEREWESLAAAEAGFEKIIAAPEFQELANALNSIIESQQIEIYRPLS